MAGTYADVPNDRLAYDRDNTVVVYWRADTPATVITLDDDERRSLNDDNASIIYTWGNGAGGEPTVVLMFPAERDLTHYFVGQVEGEFATVNRGVSAIEVSDDTTNGQDGTWSVWDASPSASLGFVEPEYRTDIQAPGTASAVTAVKFVFPIAPTLNLTNLGKIHLYGDWTAGALDHLALWHPTLDQALGPAALDWGDITQGTVDTKSFRVKNVSASRTATGVLISYGEINGWTPAQSSQRSFSTDGTTWVASVNIGTITAGAISAVVQVRRVTAANADLGVHTGRVIAAPTTYA